MVVVDVQTVLPTLFNPCRMAPDGSATSCKRKILHARGEVQL